MCWTHHPRYYFVTYGWTLERVKLVCVCVYIYILQKKRKGGKKRGEGNWQISSKVSTVNAYNIFTSHSDSLTSLSHRFIQRGGAHRWTTKFPWSGGEVRLQTDHRVSEGQLTHQTASSPLQSSHSTRWDELGALLINLIFYFYTFRTSNYSEPVEVLCLWRGTFPLPLTCRYARTAVSSGWGGFSL